MTSINLLPWREEARENRKKKFLIILFMMILSASAIIFMIGEVNKNSYTYQLQRNQFIKNRIINLDKNITLIKKVESQKKEMVQRVNIINTLQNDRSSLVRVFDTLAKVVPDGVYFKELQYKNNTFDLKGLAESNNRVAALMRDIDRSEIFINPSLTAVKKVSENGEIFNEFELTFLNNQDN